MEIIHFIDGNDMYGAEKMLWHLVQEQIACGDSPTIVSTSQPENESNKVFTVLSGDMGFEFQNIPVRTTRLIHDSQRLFRFVAQRPESVLHSHSYKTTILLGVLRGKQRRPPILATMHGSTNLGKFSKLAFYAWIESKVAPLLDIIVLVDDSMRNRFRKNRICRIITIHNGIPSSCAKYPSCPNQASLQQIQEFTRDGFIVGTIGRLSAEKNQISLIRAVSLLIAQHQNVKLVLIGEGQSRRALEKMIQNSRASSRVLFTGYIPDAYQAIPFFSVFALVSWKEGLPIAVLEAMRAGVPVIASNVGGIPLLLDYGKAGLLVSASSVEEIAASIETMLLNPQLGTELAQKAKERTIEEFTSRKMCLEYRAAYLKAFDSRVRVPQLTKEISGGCKINKRGCES